MNKEYIIKLKERISILGKNEKKRQHINLTNGLLEELFQNLYINTDALYELYKHEGFEKYTLDPDIWEILRYCGRNSYWLDEELYYSMPELIQEVLPDNISVDIYCIDHNNMEDLGNYGHMFNMKNLRVDYREEEGCTLTLKKD